MSQSTAAPEAPAVVSAKSLKTSIKVEPLTCAIGAELSNVNLGAASRDDVAGGRDPCAAAEAPRAVFPRPGHHARRARRLCPPLRRAGRPPGRRQRSRNPGLVRIYKTPGYARTTATRTPGTPMPPGARSRRSAACCAASNARRSAATRCGPTWSRPTSSCPSTSRPRSPACARATASRRASVPRCRSKSAWR